MDINLEKQLRKASFYVMARHLEAINGRVDFSVSDIATLLKVSRPTAKRFMEQLIDEKKATGLSDKKGKLFVMLHYGQWTSKEIERARLAYDNLIFELTS